MTKARLTLAVVLAVGLTVGVVGPHASSQDYSNLIEQVSPSVVWITQPNPRTLENRRVTPAGSGFITEVDDGDLAIVTACHVVAQGPTGMVNGQAKTIVEVFAEVTQGFGESFPATTRACDELRDVAVLQPLEQVGDETYEPVPLQTYVDAPKRAWLASRDSEMGEMVFAMGFPGPGSEFNTTFGRISSRLKMLYARGDATRYVPGKNEDGDCVMKTQVHEDGVFRVSSIGNFITGVVPIKWGLDVVAERVADGDNVTAINNVGLPVPGPNVGARGPVFAGLVDVQPDSSRIMIEEVAWDIPVEQAGPVCFARWQEAEVKLTPNFRPVTTDRTLEIDAERTLLSIDAAIRGGNSGGPIFNASGQVIGIMQLGTSEGGHLLTTTEDLRQVIR